MTDSAPYGLACPTADDARTSVLRVHGASGPRVWDQLVQQAGSSTALEKLLPVMAAADPTTRLCALALQIRMTSYTHLAAAHTTVRS